MGTLNMIVQIMKDNPYFTIDVEMIVQVDNLGNPAHNLALSDARLSAVKLTVSFHGY